MANEGKKPVGNTPPSWWTLTYFIDDEGSIFNRGIYQPEMEESNPEVVDYIKKREEEGKGPPMTAEKEKEMNSTQTETNETEASTPEEEVKAQPSGVFTSDGTELSKHTLEVIQTMQAMSDKRAQEQQATFIKAVGDIASQLKSTGGGGADGSTFSPDDLARAIAKAEQYRKGGHYYDDVKDIDPNDHDPLGATFTSYGNSYFIVDDKRPNGRAVRTPYGRVFKFLYQGNQITRVGRDQSYSSFCAFRTQSKKEIEWLRGHSLYGIDFYEDTNLALSANAVKAHLTSNIIRQLNLLDQPALITRAKAYGIPVGGSLNIIRAELALKMAEEKWEQDTEHQRTAALEGFEATLMK